LEFEEVHFKISSEKILENGNTDLHLLIFIDNFYAEKC